jgi:hypothetical protein
VIIAGCVDLEIAWHIPVIAPMASALLGSNSNPNVQDGPPPPAPVSRSVATQTVRQFRRPAPRRTTECAEVINAVVDAAFSAKLRRSLYKQFVENI